MALEFQQVHFNAITADQNPHHGSATFKNKIKYQEQGMSFEAVLQGIDASFTDVNHHIKCFAVQIKNVQRSSDDPDYIIEFDVYFELYDDDSPANYGSADVDVLVMADVEVTGLQDDNNIFFIEGSCGFQPRDVPQTIGLHFQGQKIKKNSQNYGAAIKSFNTYYTNGDHNISDYGIQLESSAGQQADDEIDVTVTFTMHDRDSKGYNYGAAEISIVGIAISDE